MMNDHAPNNALSLAIHLKNSLSERLIPLAVILFLVSLVIPGNSVHSILKTILSWLVLVIFIVMPLSPLWSIVKTIGFIFSGRLHFPKDRVGNILTDDQGATFTVFRQVVVSPPAGKHVPPGARLTLHFKVKNMSPAVNRIYSILPLPLYIGDTGFRSKLFTINGEDCQSIYEWDTPQDAENYVHSIALISILLRSEPGSFSYHITPLA